MQRRRRNGDKARPAVSIRSKLPHAESRVRRALLLWHVCALWLDAQYALDAELRAVHVSFTPISLLRRRRVLQIHSSPAQNSRQTT